jgi:hypothetical protein
VNWHRLQAVVTGGRAETAAETLVNSVDGRHRQGFNGMAEMVS